MTGLRRQESDQQDAQTARDQPGGLEPRSAHLLMLSVSHYWCKERPPGKSPNYVRAIAPTSVEQAKRRIR
jgi:hypothetical protein